MAAVWYKKALNRIMKAQLDLSSGAVTVKLLAVTSGYTLAQTHEFVSDIGAANILGRTAGLASKTVGSVADAVFDADDTSFSALTGSSPSTDVTQLIAVRDTGNDATSPLLFKADNSVVAGLPFTPTGADVPVIFPASGIAKIDHQCVATWYLKGINALMKALHDLSSAGVSVKFAAVTSGYTLSQSHEFYSDLGANVVASTGALANKTVGSVDDGVLDADDSTFSALTGSVVSQLIAYVDTGVAGTSRLLFQTDSGNTTGLPYTPTGVDVPLRFPAGGVAWLATAC